MFIRQSSYFIGIIVDNKPNEGVNEILIELIASGTIWILL